MHPELQLLEQRYRALVDEVNAGHVSPQDAMVTMQGLVAIDASGASWSIDPYSGQFTCALPGAAPVPADPAAFAASGAPAAPMNAAPDIAELSWDSPAAPPAPRQASTSAPESASRFGFLSGLLSGRGRVIAVVSVVILALAALVLLRPSPQDVPPDAGASSQPGPDATESVPDSESPQESATPSESSDPSESASPSESPSQAAPALPSAKRQDELVRALTSGDRQLVLAQLAPGVNANRVLLSTAPLAGAARLGFAVRPVEVVSGEAAKAFLVISVSTASGLLEEYRVPLVRAENAWRIGASLSMEKK